MASVLVYTSPAQGHLFPALGVALELRNRGHEVHMRTLAGEVERVRALGLKAEAIAAEVESREMDDWRAGNPLKAVELAMRTFGDRAVPEIDDVRQAIAETSAEALLVDTNSWGAQAVAEASGLPWATFQPYFTPLPGDGVPPFGPGFPLAGGTLGKLRDKVAGKVVIGKFQRVLLPGVNRARALVGLPELAAVGEFLTRPPLVLYCTARELEYERPSWPENFRFVGPLGWSPDAEEPAWLADVERPVALVTCSTERQQDLGILEAALSALPDEGMFVVGTSAAFDPGELSAPTGEHARVERFIPHDAVLPRAEVVVCHGGMGIAQRALRNGVPLVVVPFGRDQLEVARRVEHAGAGVMLTPKKLDAESLAAAVKQARTMSAAAERVATALAHAGGAGAAADAFEELLV